MVVATFKLRKERKSEVVWELAMHYLFKKSGTLKFI